jgi:hypothetical protein
MTLILTPALWRFFTRAETPTALAWPFLALAVFGFGVLPLAGAINLTLRARRGKTVVTASPSGLVIERQGALDRVTKTNLRAVPHVGVEVPQVLRRHGYPGAHGDSHTGRKRPA